MNDPERFRTMMNDNERYLNAKVCEGKRRAKFIVMKSRTCMIIIYFFIMI